MAPPTCPKCRTRASDWTDVYCGKCGERLPALHAGTAWWKQGARNLGMTLAVFVGMPMLAAGIALWFMGPAWLYHTETYLVRSISIGFMVGGPVVFLAGLRLDRLVPAPGPPVERAEEGHRSDAMGRAESAALELGGEEASNEVRKPAVVALVFDKSSSMAGEKLTEAVKGAIGFVEAMDEGDTLIWLPFDSQVYPGTQGRKSEIGGQLIKDIGSTIANGMTALYDAISQAYRSLEKQRNLLGYAARYGIVVLTDGQDTNSKQCDLAQLEAMLRAADAGGMGIQVRTIGIGDADHKVLARIAARTHSEHSRVDDPFALADVYRDIARYWGRTAALGRKGDKGAARKCAACGAGMQNWTNEYCPRCGAPLTALPEAVKKGKERAWYVGAALAVFVALPMLGAGIALWFMGPAWFNYRETHIIRAISIGLMAGAAAILVLAARLDRLVSVLGTPSGR